MTICLYLPDGRVAFMFRRPHVTNNDAFDAAGMRFEVVEPFVELTRLATRATSSLLDDPLQMADPRPAFTDQSPRAVRRATSSTGACPPCSAASPTSRSSVPGEEFARGHYEQLVEAAGTVQVGDDRWELDGFGLRDHSWGPRYWQAPWYYRWLTGNVGPDFGFMGSRIARRDSDRAPGAASCGTATPCSSVTTFGSAPTWEGDRPLPPRRRGRARHRGPDLAWCTGRCSTSSRCATAAPTPTATSW